jgi:hypothetical protein
VGAFVCAVDALRTGRIPADLRAALYRALLLVPGIEVTDTRDPQDGTRRIVLACDDGARHNAIFIDPANGQFAGERRILTRGMRGLKAGTLTTSTTVSVATVDTIGQVPAGA